jgi:hypothetical protein
MYWTHLHPSPYDFRQGTAMRPTASLTGHLTAAKTSPVGVKVEAADG